MKIESNDPKLDRVAELFESYSRDSGTSIQSELAKFDRVVEAFLEHFPFLRERERELTGLVESFKDRDFEVLVRQINGDYGP